MVEQNFTQIVLLEPILEYNDFEIHLMLIEQSVQIQQWRTKEKKEVKNLKSACPTSFITKPKSQKLICTKPWNLNGCPKTRSDETIGALWRCCIALIKQ